MNECRTNVVVFYTGSMIYAIAGESKNGGMITSCICHGCNWAALTVDSKNTSKNSFEHYADWFYGKTTGEDSMHIDIRLPNGGGAIHEKECSKYP